ncbi:MAG: c-type cytochrome domain-containing protein, partial [Planctomycetaceae bacterium]
MLRRLIAATFLVAVMLPWCIPCTPREVRAADAARGGVATGSVDEVRAVLRVRCVACHGALAQQAGLRVDTTAALLAGGDDGAVVAPGDPAASR